MQRVAREHRVYVPACVDPQQESCIGEAVERQRAGERDHVPAIGEAAAEARVLAGMGVEMHTRRVLVEARGDLMLGFFDGNAIDVIDFFTDRVVAEAVRTAGKYVVVSRPVDLRARAADRRHPR